MLDGLILLRKKFRCERSLSRIVSEGSNFGGAQNIWGNLYLNSTTVLFHNGAVMYSNKIFRYSCSIGP